MWQQLVIESGRDQAMLLSELMSRFGAHSVSLQDSHNEAVFDRLDGEQPLWSQTTVSGLWPERADLRKVIKLLEDALAPAHLPPFRTETLVDQQWERVWLDRYEPININNRLWICPVDKQPPENSLPVVYLDPGLAFGTGTHATTQLCLNWLTEQPLVHSSVIDYGCGSGILAIAALKLGAQKALGVDIDAQAVAVSTENAILNSVADRYAAVLPSNLPQSSQADVVVANILAEPLESLAAILEKSVAANGRLALSGMLEAQVDRVRSCYQHLFDLTLETKDGWALLAGRKKS